MDGSLLMVLFPVRSISFLPLSTCFLAKEIVNGMDIRKWMGLRLLFPSNMKFVLR
jgi:hypothetical protein